MQFVKVSSSDHPGHQSPTGVMLSCQPHLPSLPASVAPNQNAYIPKPALSKACSAMRVESVWFETTPLILELWKKVFKSLLLLKSLLPTYPRWSSGTGTKRRSVSVWALMKSLSVYLSVWFDKVIMKPSWPSIEGKNNLYFLLVLYLSGGWLQEAWFITAESRDHHQPAAARQICSYPLTFWCHISAVKIRAGWSLFLCCFHQWSPASSLSAVCHHTTDYVSYIIYWLNL